MTGMSPRSPRVEWLRSPSLLAVALLLASTHLAVARPADPLRVCETAWSANTNKQIEACTRIIAAKGQSNRRLAIAYFNRGWAYIVRGRHEAAAKDFEQAIRFEPDFYSAFRSQGNALHRAGKFKQAIVAFE